MKRILFLFLFSFAIYEAFAQIPEFINYQAVLRDASGASLAPGTPGSITFKLYDNLSTATVSYEEVHNFTVNNSGIVNLKIGQGTPVGSNTLPGNVNWFGGEVCYEVYLNGNIIGTRQAFASVPYAIYAKRSEGDLPQGQVNQTLYWDNTLNQWRPTSNLSNNGSNVNIGPTLNGPGNKLHVSTLNTSDSSAVMAVKFNAGGRDAGIRSYVVGSTNSSTLDLNQTLIGTVGTASNTGNGPSMGLLGIGYSSGHAFGLTGLAGATSNTAFAIGVYGGFINSPTVSANSWAGYMDGNLFVKDSLFLGGVTNPGNAGDVLMRSTTGKARWQTLNSSNPINMFSTGISSVSPTGPSTSFTINTPAPVFANNGIGTITGSYPNYVLNVPSSSLSVIGNSITLSQGTVAVTQTVGSLFGNGTPGYLPTYSGATTMSISNIFRNGTNNRIGINTTTPATMLHLVKSLGADTLLLESQSLTSGIGIGLKQINNRYNISLNSGRLIIDQNNVERMVFSSGNIGIGITSPVVPVEVSNSNSVGIRYNGSNTNGAFLQVNTTIAAAPAGYAYLQNGNILANHITNSNGDWILNVNNVNRINVIGANGNVGIGVAAPNNKLHVALGDVNIDLNQGYKIGNEYVLNRDATTVYLGSNIVIPTVIRAGTEKIRVLTNGNVGIGTTNPLQLLHVAGNTTSNNYLFNTAKTYYYNIGESDFAVARPDLATVDMSFGFGGIGLINSTGPNALIAPIHLPDGALVTLVEIWFEDNNTTGDMTISFQSRSNGSNSIVSLGSTTTTGASTAVQLFPIPGTTTINNAINSYQLRVFSNAWSPNATKTMRIVNARITYTKTEAD